jgi:NADH-ubiquinone oxidoreductase chain 5
MLTLPFIGASIAGLLGRRLGVKGTNFIVLSSLFISMIFSLILSYEVILKGSPVSIRLGSWMDTGILNLDWGFTIDTLGSWLSSTVLVISFLVHIFATSYMSSDPTPQRFMCLLLGFTASMIILVTGDSLGIIFLGWELIGITSFLLIGYWWDRSAACNAAVQALIVNRIGDCSFTLALMLIVITTGTLDLDSLILLFNSDHLIIDSSTVNLEWQYMLVSWAGVFLVVAAFGKSAQFLLHTWLPNSMEGPTPVSALLHAATLVAGGTYLLLRCSAIVGTSNLALFLAATFGTITAILAASTALFQYDAKRIIAYSTMSQFGYLTASIGLGQTSSTLFHLSSHSGFKALLFITAGGVIHATSDEQDIRKLGGLISSLPFTYVGMFIGSLSLIATPYLSGFYSKDLILEISGAQWVLSATWLWFLGSIVAGITACYSIRLLSYIYLGTPNGPRKIYEMSHEQPIGIVIPIIFLSILAITFGYFAREVSVGLGNFTLAGKESIWPAYLIEADFGINIWAKNFAFIATLVGVVSGIIIFIIFPAFIHLTRKQNNNFSLISYRITNIFNCLINGLSNKWWIDALYARGISWPGLQLGLIGSKYIDRGVLEILGPIGLSKVLIPVDYAANTTFSIANISSQPIFSLTSDYNLSIAQPNMTNEILRLQERDIVFFDFLNYNKGETKNFWIGYTLPDYSSYVIIFILLSLFVISIQFVFSINLTYLVICIMIVLGSISIKLY